MKIIKDNIRLIETSFFMILKLKFTVIKVNSIKACIIKLILKKKLKNTTENEIMTIPI